MSNVSTLSVNLLLERVYLEGQVHMMYEQILKEDEPKTPENESLVKQVLADLKLNADFMFTFGVGIAGFVGPVNELLSNKGIHVTPYDTTLLVITALYILLTKSKRDIDVLMAKVKEHKLDSELKKVIKFVNGTLGLFRIIGNKVGVTVTTLVDVLAFTFMSVPVLNLIKNLAADKGYNIDNFEQLFAGVTLSAGAYLLKNVLKKRIKESEEDFGNELEWAENVVQPFIDIKITQKPKGKGLYKLIQHIFNGTRFYIQKEEHGDQVIYELNDNTGTYADFYKDQFTIKNIRERLMDDIKDLQRREGDRDVLQQYVELYEVLKPVLFKGKSYEKKKIKESEEGFEWAEETVQPIQNVPIHKIKNLKGKKLAEFLQKYVFPNTKYFIHDIGSIILLGDNSYGTYAQLSVENFTVENIRLLLQHEIMIFSESGEEYSEQLKDNIELYETLKPVLFPDKGYKIKKPK